MDAAEPDHPGDRTPTVVVSHLDITYRVLGSSSRGPASGQSDGRSLRGLLDRSRPQVGYREVPAVMDVSFVAHHGESIGIIGRNGSGKSTLLRAVAGLIPPSSGHLWVTGEPSLLGVNAVLMNKLSGERNIFIGGQALGLSREEIAARFDDIVEFSGIGDAVYRPMGTYSSGMAARLRFAISTAAAPDVLMIDEALATGDAEFRERSAERIAAIREQAGTVFLVSHSNSNIRQICDRVLWMEQGRLIADGTTEEILPQYEATLPRRGKAARQASEIDPPVPGVERWGGESRLETAAATVGHVHEPPVDGCFVVGSRDLAMARVASTIAARLGWPLLWTRPNSLLGGTRDQLARLHPARVVVVGGAEQVSDETVAAIQEAAGGQVERVGTDDSTTTSIDLLRAFPPRDAAVLHLTPPANGTHQVAATVAAAAAGQGTVILDPSVPQPEALRAIGELAPATVALTGNPEDWSTAAHDALREVAGEVTFPGSNGPLVRATRVWNVAPKEGTVFVTGLTTPIEVIAAVAAAGATGRPLFLTRVDSLPDIVWHRLRALRPTRIVLIGGSDVIRPALRQRLGEALGHGQPDAATASSAATNSPAPTDQS